MPYSIATRAERGETPEELILGNDKYEMKAMQDIVVHLAVSVLLTLFTVILDAKSIVEWVNVEDSEVKCEFISFQTAM